MAPILAEIIPQLLRVAIDSDLQPMVFDSMGEFAQAAGDGFAGYLQHVMPRALEILSSATLPLPFYLTTLRALTKFISATPHLFEPYVRCVLTHCHFLAIKEALLKPQIYHLIGALCLARLSIAPFVPRILPMLAKSCRSEQPTEVDPEHPRCSDGCRTFSK